MHVIITGYYKKNNLGDDLIEYIAKIIFSKKKFKNYVTTYKTVPIEDIILPENSINCDRVILFGGETLNDYFLDKLIDLYRLKPTVKFCAIGVSCNQDYTTIINKLNIFEKIIFRNELDYKNLSISVTNNKNKIYTNTDKFSSDIVFLKNLSNKNFLKRIIKKNIVGFFLSQTSIYNLNQEKENTYITYVVNLIRFFIKLNYKIYLFAMCCNNKDSENDMIINQKVLNYLSDHEKSYIKAYSNNRKILSKITLIRFAVCWRFHSHILCTMNKIPFISISNTPKVITFLNENNLNELSCSMFNYEDKINYIINNERILKNKLNILYKKNKKKSYIYLNVNNYFTDKKENTFYIDKNTYEYIYIKLKEFYNSHKINDNNFNAQIIIFFLMRTINNEYLYGLQEKIFKGLDKLKDDIFWLINDCIIKKNLMFYETVSELLKREINPDGIINIKFLDQNDYKDLHRAGWQYIVDNLTELHGTKGILCDLNLDRTFHWNYIEYEKLGIIPYKKNWIGFIHHTCNTSYSIYNTINLFKKKLFLQSLQYCTGLIVLSDYLRLQIENLLKIYKLDIKVYTLYHPTEFVSEKFMFTPKKFTLAIKKKIIQIGAWMRNIHAINKLNIDNSPLFLYKYVLIGKKMEKYYLNDNNNNDDEAIDYNKNITNDVFIDDIESNTTEIETDNIITIENVINETSFKNNIITKTNINISGDNYERKVKLKKNVYIINYLKNNEYDELLSENLVFINLVDASAVNTVIECIVRNTPIYINRLPALEEILGTKYPLFYDNICNVENMLTIEYVDKAYNYLKNLNKDKLHIDYFIEEFKKIIKDVNNNICKKLEKEINTLSSYV
jgi:hypothetical protein